MSQKLPIPLRATSLTPNPEKMPRIGLCLGGGGARGLAHILILEVFDELGIRPAAIAGTSIGALLGAAYASGLSATYIRSLAEETLSARFDLITQLFSARTPPLQKIFSVFPMRSALLDPLALLDLILPKQMAATFEELEIPTKIMATNLAAREPHIFSEGGLRQALAASIAIPGLFSPVDVNGELFADGGIVDPLPYRILPDDIELVVAIDVSGGARSVMEGKRPSMISVLTQSVLILQKTIIQERLQQTRPDLYIEITLEKYGALHFHKAKDILRDAGPVKADFRSKLARLLSSEPAET
ncbi:MAG: patatin-like phospholipase family protein [Pseudomonadota bacterium]